MIFFQNYINFGKELRLKKLEDKFNTIISKKNYDLEILLNIMKKI